MACPVWAGILSFGLVSLPVGLYSTTGGHTMCPPPRRGTSDRIRNRRLNEHTALVVGAGSIHGLT